MTRHSVVPSTLILERHYAASPERVFGAWSKPEALLQWALPGGDWNSRVDRFDFRVGGGSLTSFGPPSGEIFVSETEYFDVVAGQRIVSASSMTTDGVRIFVGLLTIELVEAPGGCRLILTEQGVFLDGHDQPANHEAGWSEMLRSLGRWLEMVPALQA